jgi:hypothetical protein
MALFSFVTMLKHLNVVNQAADTEEKGAPDGTILIIDQFGRPRGSAKGGQAVQLFGDRPPLLDTLTGGRSPGRKVPDHQSGLGDNKRK